MNIQLRPHQLRGVEAMKMNRKGQLIVPTGGGKTLKMITDAVREFQNKIPQTIVVVAPRILLAEQLSAEFLEFVVNAKVFHCHSGETHHASSTSPKVIEAWVEENSVDHRLIVTTYNSLRRLQEAQIEVNTIYFDEAHNSVQSNFFGPTRYFAEMADRCYFFTATRKTSLSPSKPGMNDADVYGDIICSVSAPELIEGGYIVPPQVHTHKSKTTAECGGCVYNRDKENLLSIIQTYGLNKVLVVAKKTKDIIGLCTQTDFQARMSEMGYDVLHISSKYGAFLNNEKIDREKFFDTLNDFGKQVDKKFVVLHFDILAEGLNISCLNGVVFQRGTDYIKILQTVGRAIRLDPRDAMGIRSGVITPGDVKSYHKQCGVVVTPVFDRAGTSIAKKINKCIDVVFNRGQLLDSAVRR